jgi:hypothetical protein
VLRQALTKLASQANNYAGKGAAMCCTLRHAATKAYDAADISLLSHRLASAEAACAEGEFSSPMVNVF